MANNKNLIPLITRIIKTIKKIETPIIFNKIIIAIQLIKIKIKKIIINIIILIILKEKKKKASLTMIILIFNKVMIDKHKLF